MATWCPESLWTAGGDAEARRGDGTGNNCQHPVHKCTYVRSRSGYPYCWGWPWGRTSPIRTLPFSYDCMSGIIAGAGLTLLYIGVLYAGSDHRRGRNDPAVIRRRSLAVLAVCAVSWLPARYGYPGDDAVTLAARLGLRSTGSLRGTAVALGLCTALFAGPLLLAALDGRQRLPLSQPWNAARWRNLVVVRTGLSSSCSAPDCQLAGAHRRGVCVSSVPLPAAPQGRVFSHAGYSRLSAVFRCEWVGSTTHKSRALSVVTRRAGACPSHLGAACREGAGAALRPGLRRIPGSIHDGACAPVSMQPRLNCRATRSLVPSPLCCCCRRAPWPRQSLRTVSATTAGSPTSRACCATAQPYG